MPTTNPTNRQAHLQVVWLTNAVGKVMTTGVTAEEAFALVLRELATDHPATFARTLRSLEVVRQTAEAVTA